MADRTEAHIPDDWSEDRSHDAYPGRPADWSDSDAIEMAATVNGMMAQVTRELLALTRNDPRVRHMLSEAWHVGHAAGLDAGQEIRRRQKAHDPTLPPIVSPFADN
jgi:hypothetical protein